MARRRTVVVPDRACGPAALILLIWLLLPPCAPADGEGCLSSARLWFSELDEAEQELTARRTREHCEFCADWIGDQTAETGSPDRDEICRYFTLVWTHNECVFLRDYVDPAAYVPCMAWSREMFVHCRENDLTWFRR